jgi:two-component system, chemotaxis family, protein-glutamate methylesterase/glutaminase
MRKDKIKVLVADDSQVTRMLLVHLLNADPQIEVVGTVTDGQAALDFLHSATVRPDVVLMDIHMPHMDGFEATRHIMETSPLPIVICTATSDPHELAVTFRSMEAGALACVEKPVAATDVDFERRASNLLQTVRLMSEVKVVRRWPRPRAVTSAASKVSAPLRARSSSAISVIGIGASTGGPPVLQTILSGLPKDFPIPLLIVQHIAAGFLPGMVEWLNQTTGLRVHIAAHGATPLPGHAYIAPDDFHMGILPSGRIALARDVHESGLRPAVSYLFRSIAENCGAHATGVLLTGMGKDGAAELKLMRDRGAFTIAQDRESSVVHGMPGEAIDLGAACVVLAADRIAGALITRTALKPTSAGDLPS